MNDPLVVHVFQPTGNTLDLVRKQKISKATVEF